jgi:hypothetical protein
MYADDMAATCASPESLQAAIDAISGELRRWRLKASVKPGDGSKTAVMVVGKGAAAAAARQHGWTWGGVAVPVVDSYRYLGVLLHQEGGLAQHFAFRKQKADAAARALTGVLKQSGLPWRVRRDCLVAAVQPVLTYAAQIWSSPAKAHRDMLDAWQMKHLSAALHCPANASRACVLPEVGLMPLSVVCEKLALAYWHHVSFKVGADRLLAQVAAAWPQVSHNPWLKNVRALVRDYDIDEARAAGMSRGEFAGYVQEQATARALRLWGAARGQVSRAYVASFGAGAVCAGRPAARSYFRHLSESSRGRAAELIMQLRAGCLPLRAACSHQRRGESAADQRLRELCPCCKAGAETPTHFLLQCPAYALCRHTLMAELQRLLPAWQWQRMQPLADNEQATLLLSDAVVGQVAPGRLGQGAINACAAVATFVYEAWSTRNTALTGRGPNAREREG